MMRRSIYEKIYDYIDDNEGRVIIACNAGNLGRIQQTIDANKVDFTKAELVVLYPQIKQFYAENGRLPKKDAKDEFEVRLAYALAKINDLKMRGASNVR